MIGQVVKPKYAFCVDDYVTLTGGSDEVRLRIIDISEKTEEAFCKTLSSNYFGWYPMSSLSLIPTYEKDDGELTEEQIAEVRAASPATEILVERFTESLFPLEGEPAKTGIDQTLSERGSRYGSFNDLATISQGLKEAMRATPGWAKLTASQKEALEMVQHKVARMLNGDPTYEDNAVDIVGYATLMMKNMQGDLKI